MTISTQDYPFAKEFITDAEGRICKVVLDLDAYQKLLEALEDEGLYIAMQEVKNETPLSLAEALLELDKNED